MRTLRLASLGWVLGLGCSSAPAPPVETPPAAQPVRVDGSSTVFPITKNVTARYARVSKNVVNSAVSGTGPGFQQFCHGRLDVAAASRPIATKELKECAGSGVEFIELPIAFDGIAVVVHPDNDWVTTLTVADLKKIWEPGAQGKVTLWKHVRPDWPAVKLHLVAPDTESGTYDYFTKAIIGEEGESRRDYVASEDDDKLVESVANDGLALGYFGFAYVEKNKKRLRVIPIDDGNAKNGVGAIAPAVETIRGATYQPLSRPLFIYVNASSLARAEVDDFVRFYVDAAAAAAAEVGSIPLPRRALDLVAKRLEKRAKGSTFHGGTELGLNIDSLLDAYAVEVSQVTPAAK